jgi:hypothetical protein
MGKLLGRCNVREKRENIWADPVILTRDPWAILVNSRVWIITILGKRPI